MESAMTFQSNILEEMLLGGQLSYGPDDTSAQPVESEEGRSSPLISEGQSKQPDTTPPVTSRGDASNLKQPTESNAKVRAETPQSAPSYKSSNLGPMGGFKFRGWSAKPTTTGSSGKPPKPPTTRPRKSEAIDQNWSSY